MPRSHSRGAAIKAVVTVNYWPAAATRSGQPWHPDRARNFSRTRKGVFRFDWAVMFSQMTDSPLPTPTLPTPTMPTPTMSTASPLPTKSASPSSSSSALEVPKDFLGFPLWFWIVVLLIIVVAAIMISALGKTGKKKSQWDQSFGMLLADARWFADSLTLAVADRTMSSAEIVRYWTDGSPRIAALSQRLYELAAIAPDDKRAQAPGQVVYAIDALRRALDADVRLRTQGFAPGQDTLIAESAMIVAQRRNELLATIAAVG